MAETTLQLGFVPKERGEYTSGATYYKDNVVQYNGSSYIADPVGWSELHPTATYVTIAPTDASGNLNAGWRVFASGNNTFTTGEKVDNVGIDDEPTAGSDNLVKSGGVFDSINKVETNLGKFENTKSTIVGSNYSNIIYGKFKENNVIKVTLLGDSLVGFVLRDDAQNILVSPITCGQTITITLQRDTEFLQIYVASSQIVSAQNVTFKLSLNQNLQLENLQTSENEIYPIVKSLFEGYAPQISLYKEGYFIKTDGGFTQNANYDVYRVDINQQVDYSYYIYVSSIGAGISLIYGYGDNDSDKIKNYYTATAQKKYFDGILTLDESVKYLLFTTNHNTPQLNVYAVTIKGLIQTERNIVTIFSNTPENTKYPSEKLVKDSIDSILKLTDVSESLTFDQQGVINAAGTISHSSDQKYNLYKYVVPANKKVYLKCNIQGYGYGTSIAYGYNSNGSPVKNYCQISSPSLQEFTISPDPEVAYILFQKYTGTPVFSIMEYSIGIELQNLLKEETKITTIHIPVDATGDDTLVKQLVRIQTQERTSKYNQFIIELDSGEYSLDCSSESGITTRGINLPSFVTIRGVSKENTILTFRYSGTDDNVMSEYSGLTLGQNEIHIENLSIYVKNVRYAVHGLLGAYSKTYFKNVKLVHEGFDSDHYDPSQNITPTYYAPMAWASGTGNCSICYFEGCDFIAETYPGWYTHDQRENGWDATFYFKDCTFINKAQSSISPLFNYYYNASFVLLSYGAENKMVAYLTNCHLNRYVDIRPSTMYSNVKCTSELLSDGNEIVYVSSTNNNDKDYHYQNGNCSKYLFESGLSKGNPVVLKSAGIAELWDETTSKNLIIGVLTHDVSTNGFGSVICRGIIPQTLLGTSFIKGKNIGWNGTSWVEDDVNPIFVSISSNFVKFL